MRHWKKPGEAFRTSSGALPFAPATRKPKKPLDQWTPAEKRAYLGIVKNPLTGRWSRTR